MQFKASLLYGLGFLLLPSFCSGRVNSVLDTIHKSLSGSFGNGYQGDHVCCTPDKWEATAFITIGDVVKDSIYAYVNGTGRLVFDKHAQKSYMGFNLTEYSPKMAYPESGSRSIIKDETKAMTYDSQVEDGQAWCDKEKINKTEYTLCIPKDATFLSRGTIGANVDLYTYQYIAYIEDAPIQNTATVHIGSDGHCVPMVFNTRVGMNIQGVDFIYTLDVHDLKYTVTDDSVFIPPASCN